jgi:hypothetical protein
LVISGILLFILVLGLGLGLGIKAERLAVSYLAPKI